ncbi:uncharacterized protein RHOBADRAFT_65340 [Rhodotorula graminis WP1]|uniref:Uncharacterized protein n=1 Tax=Rhodotorula graminis (strain WP1) TaxID=578459 RepID=A0A0P9EXA6_RHOGW|nr:uncharacterized protein RHOBADRAFT_65340 [Rhodotorula graminis WP1]KPV74103.1 hypothetical protein RHOBADRAFT_65340 [Rhodotorula graminis WP1]
MQAEFLALLAPWVLRAPPPEQAVGVPSRSLGHAHRPPAHGHSHSASDDGRASSAYFPRARSQRW